jgi:hypothetical protein
MASADNSSTTATQILDFLFLGGKNDAKNKSLLEESNIKYIINVTPPKDVDPAAGVPNFFKNSFRYKRCAMFDSSGENIMRFMDDAIDFIEEGGNIGTLMIDSRCHQGGTMAQYWFIVDRV